MSVNSKMTAIADEIRAKTGGVDALTLDDMASEVPKVYDAGKKAEYDSIYRDNSTQNSNGTFSSESTSTKIELFLSTSTSTKK